MLGRVFFTESIHTPCIQNIIMLNVRKRVRIYQLFKNSIKTGKQRYRSIIKVGVSQETYLFFPDEINFSIVSSIGGLQPISRDTDNNNVMYNCWWKNKKS